MYYYEVKIASRSYHSKRPLTYQSGHALASGAIVRVPLRTGKVMAFIDKAVDKPSFSTKAIDAVVSATPLPEAARQLYAWMEQYYPTRSASTLQLFIPGALKTKARAKAPNTGTLPDELVQAALEQPAMTPDQQAAVSQIENGKHSSYLLHGETGSGKTRVYAELAKRAFQKNRSALILTPEIGLTTQLTQQLKLLTGEAVIVLHSTLTLKERREAWEKIATSEEPLLIVGPRSTLFSPIAHLGIIVIDEAHDDAYKQESSPFYVASRVAAKLASLHEAKLVIGSATPSVADYYVFKEKRLPIIDMTDRAIKTASVNTKIVDKRKRDDFTRSAYLSNPLLDAIQAAYSNGEQALVYLNRRGTSRLILCQACGWESLCPRCDIAFTFHEDSYKLMCHTCGATDHPPSICPSCASPEVLYKSIGTKALLKELSRHFPEARIERFDTDLKKDERLESRYDAIYRGEVDILVGTQLLGKGLDLPHLSVVGIVNAETSLGIPDFTAREKTYQQLHQIIGRVGRGHKDGTVIIQSYDPESSLLEAAVKRDYQKFYREEITERKQYGYPPFSYLLQITCSRKSPTAAEQAIIDITHSIRSLKLAVQLVGPAPAFKARTGGYHHWQLVIKTKDRDNLLQIVDMLPKTTSYDIDPINLL